MKVKNMTWLVLASLFVVLVGLTAVKQTSAQTQGSENLLANPGFESGHHKQGGVAELTVPDGWTLHYLDNVEFLGSDAPAARPESVVWFIGDAPPAEQSLFFRDGSFALKVFKGGLPMYSALSQDVNNLEVGRRYRLVAPVYIDIVFDYNSGNKIAPANLESGLVRLGAGPTGSAWLDESAITYSGWWTAATISPFYQAYPVFIFDFTATQPNMTVFVEFGSRNSYQNNGFFLDTIGLYTLDEVDNTVNNPPASSNPPVSSGPPPTPFPTPTPRADGAIVHVVQSGDSLWSIAIQYAGALGTTAEQLLPVIRELNNNPTFVQVGQEIVVSLPDSTAAVADPVTTEAEESAEATEPTATPEVEATAEPTVAPTVEAEPAAAMTSSICVSAFDDSNGNGAVDSGEGMLAEAVFTVSRASGNVATYVSDGINEPYCFEGLEAGTYQITFSQPLEYKLTTAANWAIAVTDGANIPVQFGAQHDATAVAEAQPELISETPATGDTQTGTESSESGGFASNLGTIVLAIAGVLLLLVGVGVALVRRG